MSRLYIHLATADVQDEPYPYSPRASCRLKSILGDVILDLPLQYDALRMNESKGILDFCHVGEQKKVFRPLAALEICRLLLQHTRIVDGTCRPALPFSLSASGHNMMVSLLHTVRELAVGSGVTSLWFWNCATACRLVEIRGRTPSPLDFLPSTLSLLVAQLNKPTPHLLCIFRTAWTSTTSSPLHMQVAQSQQQPISIKRHRLHTKLASVELLPHIYLVSFTVTSASRFGCKDGCHVLRLMSRIILR